MTVVAGIVLEDGTVRLGADTLCTDTVGHVMPVNKLVVLTVPDVGRSLVVGASGSPRIGMLLRYAFEPPVCRRGSALGYAVDVAEACRAFFEARGALVLKDGRAQMDGDRILLGYASRLFQIDPEFNVVQSETYAAIGSGEGVALGALHAQYEMSYPRREMLARALAAAAAHNAYCGAPFDFVEARPIR